MSEQLNDGELLAEEPVVTPAPQVGQLLRQARESRRLSVIDIAQVLKLSVRQVDALESGDWQILPGNTFVRGFVRNYARIVQIDSAPLMALLDGSLQKTQNNLDMPQKSLPAMPQTGRAVSRRDRAVMLLGLGFVVLAASAYFLMPSNLSAWRENLQGVLDSLARKDEPTQAVPATSAAEPVFPPGATPQQIMNPQAAMSAENTPGSTVAPVDDNKPVLATAKNAGPIRFVVDKESWIEIRDRDNKPVFSQRAASGTEQSLSGDGPFTLIIGYAPGVKIFWHGEAVDLAPHTRGDVARLVLE